jgi:hypothetical protein
MTDKPSGRTVTIDGQPVPLDECGWLERRPCGCITSALVAVSGSRVVATPEQAHAHLNPTKRARGQAAKERLAVELITMTHYREHIGANWECEQHAADKAATR